MTFEWLPCLTGVLAGHIMQKDPIEVSDIIECHPGLSRKREIVRADDEYSPRLWMNEFSISSDIGEVAFWRCNGM